MPGRPYSSGHSDPSVDAVNSWLWTGGIFLLHLWLPVVTIFSQPAWIVWRLTFWIFAVKNKDGFDEFSVDTRRGRTGLVLLRLGHWLMSRCRVQDAQAYERMLTYPTSISIAGYNRGKQWRSYMIVKAGDDGSKSLDIGWITKPDFEGILTISRRSRSGDRTRAHLAWMSGDRRGTHCAIDEEFDFSQERLAVPSSTIESKNGPSAVIFLPPLAVWLLLLAGGAWFLEEASTLVWTHRNAISTWVVNAWKHLI